MLWRSLRSSENFITRLTKEEGFKNGSTQSEEIDLDAEEDIETPAFIRRSLNK
jgi:hypothetical protein